MEGGKTCAKTILRVVSIALMATGLTETVSGEALADPSGYEFKILARIPGPAPGGGMFTNDFEPYAINASGSIAFVADLDTGGEGVFAGPQSQISAIARPGQTVGGVLLDDFALGHTALNNAGSGAFVYILNPFTTPFGLNAGLFRFSLLNPAPTAVVVPGVTKPPPHAGDVFTGVYFNTSLNNQGDLVFNGVAAGLRQSGGPGAGTSAAGVFKADRSNHIVKVVIPGDTAPGGGVFDDAVEGWINERGDIAFDAHVNGEECIPLDPGFELVCGSSVYKKVAPSGNIQSIAHQGDPAPGAGVKYRQAFGPVLNDAGDMVFIGDLTPAPHVLQTLGVFLNSKGTTTPVALPGDPLPGGGNFGTASSFAYQYYLNNSGDITFICRLDTAHGGVADTGIYLVSHGKTQLVARTGTQITGVGMIADINSPGFVNGGPLQAGGIINNRGQIFFEATLTDNTGVLLVATPRGS
jgi:hypothetical protein